MAKSAGDRLQNLKFRRHGPFTGKLHEAALNDYVGVENYERRSAQQATQFALGAMQEVDPKYTENSYGEGERIRAQLQKRLPEQFRVEFHYQGSVPLNVHIKGVSDIDLLVLRQDFVTGDPNGPRWPLYGPWHGEQPVPALRTLRNSAISALEAAFTEVHVDKTSSKCITLSGGSLRRSIDVIPAHWHDTFEWQSNHHLSDRGIKILNAAEGVTLLNMPFLHIEKIHSKDLRTLGGTKKVIRLLKNISADADTPEHQKLSSYDIASFAWHIPDNDLSVQLWNELALVDIARKWMCWVANNREAASKLKTPDGSRAIFETSSKLDAATSLANDLIDLEIQLLAELDPTGQRNKPLSHYQIEPA